MKSQTFIWAAVVACLTACNEGGPSASRQFEQLPLTVQKTVRGQAPDAEISSISRTARNGMDAYEIVLRSGTSPKLVVGADGTLIHSDLPIKPTRLEGVLTPTGIAGTPLSALPVPAQNAIQSHRPRAPVRSIERHEKDGQIYYEVRFEEKEKYPPIRVSENGNLIPEPLKVTGVSGQL